MPFADLANNAGIERNNLVPMFGENQDAVTFHIGGENVLRMLKRFPVLPGKLHQSFFVFPLVCVPDHPAQELAGLLQVFKNLFVSFQRR